LEGHGHAVLVDGEPGIGKSRLAHEAKARADDDGLLVASATCYDGDWSPPFTVWSQVVRDLGEGVVRAEPANRRNVLLEAIPDLSDHGVAHAPQLPAEEARFRATDAIARLLLTVAKSRPLLVVLDDLQWADPASLDVLGYMARFLSEARIMLLATHRAAAVGLDHPLARTLGELDRHGVAEHISLGPLSDADALRLIKALGGAYPPPLAAEIIHEAHGHPFFIVEVVRHLADQGGAKENFAELGVPQSIRHTVGLRLAHLSSSARRLLAVASAFTRPFAAPVLEAMTGLRPEDVSDAMDEAVRAGMLQALSQGAYDFSHALVRRALYDDVGPSRRARLHRRIAQALERVYEGREAEQAGELAAQYHASRSLPGAAHGLRYALLAADQARAAHAYEQAAALLQLAADLASGAAVEVRCDVVCRLAIAHAEALHLAAAARSAEDALGLLESTGADAERIAGFIVSVAYPLQEATMLVWELTTGSPRDAVIARLVQRGLNVLGEHRGLTWARLRLLERPTVADEAGPINSGRWLGFDPEAVLIARTSGSQDDYAATLVAQDPRTPDETGALLNVAESWTSPSARIRAYGVVVGTMLLQHGALREAVGVASRALAYSEEVGSLPGQLEALTHRAFAQERLGEFDAAAADGRRADDLLGRLTFAEPPSALRQEFPFQKRVRRLQQVDWAALGRYYRDSALDARGSPSWIALFEAALAAEAFARAGETAEARQLLGWVLPAILGSEPMRLHQNGAVAYAGGAAWELADPTMAAQIRRAALDVIEAGVGDCWWTSNELTVARMSSLCGDLADAQTWFDRARRALEASGQRPLRGVVDYDEARHRIRHRLPGALPLLTAARTRFADLDMPQWVATVDALIAAASDAHPDGLTAREVEVLRLLASGLTNAEIASRFVISIHTVERHLANAYRKMNVRNRAEAAAYALQARL
jgi:DNA-binding CsgD family transcriptional regulator